MSRDATHDRRGLTLAEVLVALVIIAMAGVAVATSRAAYARAREAQRSMGIDTLREWSWSTPRESAREQSLVIEETSAEQQPWSLTTEWFEERVSLNRGGTITLLRARAPEPADEQDAGAR